MRALWVTNLAPPYRRHLWRRLGIGMDLTVGLLADSEPNRQWDSRTPEPQYSLVRLPSRPLGPSGLLRHLYILTKSAHSVLSSAQPDVVILGSYESPAYQSILRAARAEAIPVVLWYESHANSHRFKRALVPWLRERTINEADSVLALGKLAHASASSQTSQPDKVLRCNHPVDALTIRRAVDHFRRQCVDQQAARHRYLYVGQLIERKNIIALVKAFGIVAHKGDELLVVGEGPQERWNGVRSSCGGGADPNISEEDAW
jgi:glycosyltransferase involved in cell wall biosynthesis